MKVAFYAPLNAPDSPVPSGDRQIARTIVAALRREGHDVVQPTRFRSLDISGDAERIDRLELLGRRLAERCCQQMLRLPRAQQPDLWLTYHLYHKAPDWIGPQVAATLGIPYAVVEASYAPKRTRSPWASGLSEVALALGMAGLVIGLKARDEACVRPLLSPGARYVNTPPFLDCTAFASARPRRDAHRARLCAELGLRDDRPWLLAVGMMRPGSKLSSYTLLADAMAHLAGEEFELLIVGDGQVAADVRSAFAPLGGQVHFLGCRQGGDLAGIYTAADVFVWPAMLEPIGMVFVEAQAAGLPIVGADRSGVVEVVQKDVTGLLPPEGSAEAFAAAVHALLRDPARRRAMGAAGAEHAIANHDISTAGRLFVSRLVDLLEAPMELPS